MSMGKVGKSSHGFYCAFDRLSSAEQFIWIAVFAANCTGSPSDFEDTPGTGHGFYQARARADEAVRYLRSREVESE